MVLVASPQVRSFGKQLLESVAYLHDLQCIHTDLKPENILLASLEYSKHSELPGTRYASCLLSLTLYCPACKGYAAQKLLPLRCNTAV